MLGSKTTAPRGVGPVPKQTRMRHDPVQTVALESMACREDGMPQDRDAFSHSRILVTILGHAVRSRAWPVQRMACCAVACLTQEKPREPSATPSPVKKFAK